MWNLVGFDGQPLEDWEQQETEKGVTYYINQKTNKSQWIHPLLLEITTDLAKCNVIKYAAYRTAVKVRKLQKQLQLHLLDISTVFAAFEQRGLRAHQNDCTIDSVELGSLLRDLYFLIKKSNSTLTNAELCSELLLNLLLNLYDFKRIGSVTVLSAKVALIVLCNARLRDKYRFLFCQVVDYNNCLSQQKMFVLFHNIARIPEELSEKVPFGTHLVSAAVDSCFQRLVGNMGISEEIFLDWLMAEPQTLVWLSTFYRLSSSETVKHDTKCNFCKANPIIGLRYKCLKCFNYDLCQNCFFNGHVNKNHKIKHPTHEYCKPITPKEDTKAFMQTICNNLSKKHRQQSKQRYLPIGFDKELTDKVEENLNHVHPPKVNSAEVPSRKVISNSLQTYPYQDWSKNTEVKQVSLVPNKKRDLESIVYHLEKENKGLHQELESLTSKIDSGAETNPTQHLLAKQEVLQDHNRQLEIQLQRLRILLKDQLNITVSNYSSNNIVEECHQLSPPALHSKNQINNPLTLGNSSTNETSVTEDPLINYLQKSPPSNMNTTKPIIDNLHSTRFHNASCHSNRLMDKFDNLSVSDTLYHETNSQYHEVPVNNQLMLEFPTSTYNSQKTQSHTLNSLPCNSSSFQLQDYTEIISHSRNSSSSYNTMHGPSTLYSIDFTDVNQQVNESHYSLPIPNQSHFSDEESELDEIIQGLKNMFPTAKEETNLHYTNMVLAAHSVGQALSTFVSHVACKESGY